MFVVLTTVTTAQCVVTPFSHNPHTTSGAASHQLECQDCRAKLITTDTITPTRPGKPHHNTRFARFCEVLRRKKGIFMSLCIVVYSTVTGEVFVGDLKPVLDLYKV